MDRLLDHARVGPFHLRQPEIARLVIQALYDGESRFQRYHLHAFVVMPNHVIFSLLLRARTEVASAQGFTAHDSIAFFAATPRFGGKATTT